MSLSELVFHGICIMTVVSGFYAVYTENLVHAVFALLATFSAWPAFSFTSGRIFWRLSRFLCTSEAFSCCSCLA